MNHLGYTLAVSEMQRVLPRRKRKEKKKRTPDHRDDKNGTSLFPLDDYFRF